MAKLRKRLIENLPDWEADKAQEEVIDADCNSNPVCINRIISFCFKRHVKPFPRS